MKIVLLPGMDGTGRLFAPLMQFLDTESCIIISYPTEGKQDYITLLEYVQSKLPSEDFILVAESFSGPIGAELAKKKIPNLKTIIFVATFISTPRQTLLNSVRHLPIKLISSLPFAPSIYRYFLFGANASDNVVAEFRKILSDLPSKTLKQRLSAVASLRPGRGKIEIPAVYILPDKDMLVPHNKCVELDSICNNYTVKQIQGPHFILQANPEECAAIINSVS